MRISLAVFLAVCGLAPGVSLVSGLDFVVAVDANRDGEIDKDDYSNSGEASLHSGGLVLVNCDDDDKDGKRDCDDDRLNSAQDFDDAAIVAALSESSLKKLSVRLECPVGAARLFVPDEETSPGQSWELPEAPEGGVAFRVEACRFAGPDWDGTIIIHAKAEDADGVVHEGKAALRVAPLVFRPGSAPPDTVFVREFPGRNEALIDGLTKSTADAGCQLHIVPGDAPYPANHIWLQDAVEFGECSVPGNRMVVAMPSNRNRDVDLFARDRLLGPGFGYVRVGEYRKPFAQGEGGVSWIDWYGNLEATPPVPGHPLGRILYGVDRERNAQLNPEVVATLAAQGVQEPLPLDVGWLTIKHVDEMVGFVPHAEGPNGSEPGDFWTLVPDTPSAIKLLEKLAADGHADAPMLTIFEPGLTVGKLLTDEQFLQRNRTLQAERIDPMIESLIEGLQLDPARVIRIPSLYGQGGLSRMPCMVNCLVLGGHIAMADPDGPEIDGVDPFQEEVRRLLEPTGVAIRFVDDRQYHKWSGNVHCATNVVRAPMPQPWWKIVGSSKDE